MNEEEALRYAANILRTLSTMEHPDIAASLLYAARRLDGYYQPEDRKAKEVS